MSHGLRRKFRGFKVHEEENITIHLGYSRENPLSSTTPMPLPLSREEELPDEDPFDLGK